MKLDKNFHLIVELGVDIIDNILDPWLDTQPLAARILWGLVITMVRYISICALEE